MKKENIRNILIIIALVVLIIGILVFGTKAVLYIRALIGNDLIIKISADKENLFLKNKDSETVSFKIYTITNLFCKTTCTSRFIDLSNSAVIETDSFDIKLSKIKEFTLISDKTGYGMDLYRFDISCNNKQTFFCESLVKEKKRSVLITLNYQPNNEETILRDKLKTIIEHSISVLDTVIFNLGNDKESLNELNKIILIDDMIIFYNGLLDESNHFNVLKSDILYSWNKFDYDTVSEKNNEMSIKINDLNNNYNLFYLDLNNNISEYNHLIDEIISIKSSLEKYKENNLSNVTQIILESLILDYNKETSIFIGKSSLSYKSFILNNLKKSLDDFNISLTKEINDNISREFKVNLTLSEINSSKINLTDKVEVDFILNEPKPVCCLNNECIDCCDESCNNKSYYPIILLHGHSFNEKTSADLSLDTFENIQRELDKDGFLNSGSVLYNPDTHVKGILGKINHPITLKASYYFDIMNNEGEEVIIETKTDDLDTYALRLKDIVDTVKYKTGKDKVIIVTHSMGGLIARRYMQIFGTDNIDRLIMISPPNHGISDNVLKYCYLF
jgi:hypothetical protein